MQIDRQDVKKVVQHIPCRTLRTEVSINIPAIFSIISMKPKLTKARPMTPSPSPTKLSAPTLLIRYFPTTGDHKIDPTEYSEKSIPIYAPGIPFLSSSSGRIGAQTE